MADDPLHHTKRIALLRRVLLGGALLAALALFSLSNMDRFGDVSDALSLSGSGPLVDTPDYRGRTDSGRAYRLTGETARQADDGTQITAPTLELAAMGSDGGPTYLHADKARFETIGGAGALARLSGNIELFLADGHVMKTDKLTANMDTQTLSAPHRLTLRGPQLNLDATRLEGDLSASIFVFHDLTMTLKGPTP